MLNWRRLYEIARGRVIIGAGGGGSSSGGSNLDGLTWGPDSETNVDMNLDNAISEIRAWGVANFTEFSFGNPVTVTGNLTLQNDVVTTSLIFRNLTSIGGNAQFVVNTALNLIQFSALEEVTGFLNISANTNLESIILPALETTGADLILEGPSVTIFQIPQLITVGNELSFSNLDSLTSLSLPNLTTTVSNAYFTLAAATSVSIPSLIIVDADLIFVGCSLMETVNLSSLVEVTLNFGIAATSLTALALPSLTTVGNGFTANATPTLISFSAPNWLPTDGTTINFSGDALSQVSVNHILARCVANAAFVSGTVDLSGGTNAAPSGQGAADVITLTGRGVTVTTN